MSDPKAVRNKMGMLIALASAALLVLDFLSFASPAHQSIEALVPVPWLVGIPLILLYNRRKFGTCLPGKRPPMAAKGIAHLVSKDSYKVSSTWTSSTMCGASSIIDRELDC